LNDLVGGRISMMFAPPQTVAPAVASGQVTNIAITSERRSPLMPELPTAAETGLPGYSAVGWFALFGPRGMPTATTLRLAEEAGRGLTAQVTRERLAALGAVPEPMTPDAFNDYVNADIAKWQRLVRERNIPLE
jgi:tripartite-type tricarboxylate transporter receptor subunit TctC